MIYSYFSLAESLYNEGSLILNKVRPDLEVGLSLMRQAASLNHKGAQAEVFWAELLGRGSKQRMPASSVVKVFQDLADSGLPSAHMVKFKIIDSFYYFCRYLLPLLANL